MWMYISTSKVRFNICYSIHSCSFHWSKVWILNHIGGKLYKLLSCWTKAQIWLIDLLNLWRFKVKHLFILLGLPVEPVPPSPPADTAAFSTLKAAGLKQLLFFIPHVERTMNSIYFVAICIQCTGNDAEKPNCTRHSAEGRSPALSSIIIIKPSIFFSSFQSASCPCVLHDPGKAPGPCFGVDYCMNC